MSGFVFASLINTKKQSVIEASDSRRSPAAESSSLAGSRVMVGFGAEYAIMNSATPARPRAPSSSPAGHPTTGLGILEATDRHAVNCWPFVFAAVTVLSAQQHRRTKGR